MPGLSGLRSVPRVAAILLATLAACSEAPETQPGSGTQALTAPQALTRTGPETADLPTTVEEYWSGAAQCLVPATTVDQLAAATLATLERYSEPVGATATGLRFAQRPRVLVEAFDDLTSEMPEREIRRLAAGCQTVYCAVNRVFGEPNGLRILYLYARFRYNASHWADRSAAPWTSEELADIILAFEDLPDGVAPFYAQGARPLVHEARYDRIARLFPTGSDTIVAVSSASSKIGIRAAGGWQHLAQHRRRAAIFHELAHDFYRQQARLLRPDVVWARAMASDEIYRRNTGRATSAVSRYALAGPEEDFAESAAAYRYAPELILKRAPNRARVLRSWLFDGMRYDTPEGCAPAASVSHRAATSAFNLIPQLDLTPSEVAVVVTECQWRLRDDASRHRVTNGRLCVGRELYRVALAKSLQRSFAGGDALSAALVKSRTANDQFLEYRFGGIEDSRVLSLTDRRALKSCGPTCHEDGRL